MHLVAIKMSLINACLLGEKVTVFILLAKIFNYTFNLFINNIVREPITDEGFYFILEFFIKYHFGGRDSFCPE